MPAKLRIGAHAENPRNLGFLCACTTESGHTSTVATTTNTRVRDAIVRAAHRSGQDRVAFYRQTAAALRKAVPFDGACWITLDPATLLFTNHFSDDLPTEGFRYVCHNEYVEEDVNKFATLTRGLRPVGVLSQATDGQLERSARYRTILAPYGFRSELRVSFVDGTTGWGCGIFLRATDRPDFTSAEATFLADVAATIAHGFRTALLPTLLDSPDAPAVPGVVLLDEAGRVDAMTGSARQWIDDLRALEPPQTGPLPSVVLSVASSANRAAATGEVGHAARARARTSSGEWLVLHATVMDTDSGPRTAVILEAARPTALAPLIADAYGLTSREREVVRLVLQGLSTDRIAAQLHLSAWTVQDHLKSIFHKVGVRSRKELVAQIFFQQYQPRITDEGFNLGPDGWFV
jgi:DNA-binding CsgD family transcriptional regulator